MKTRRTLRVAALLVCAPMTAACGDGMTAPLAPSNNAMGDWTYQAVGLAGDFFGTAITCDYDLEMFIPGSGTTFTGTYRQAELICNLTGTPQLIDFGEGDIVSGSVVGDQVQFDIDSETAHNAGTIVGDEMTGQAEVQLVVQVNSLIDTVLVVGPWSATR